MRRSGATRSLAALLAALAAACVISGDAAAETTGWMIGHDVTSFFKRLGENSVLVTDIQCRPSGRKSLNLDAAEFRVTYQTNTPNRGWALAGTTDQLGVGRLIGLGFRVARQDSFVRPDSGLRFYCLLYRR